MTTKTLTRLDVLRELRFGPGLTTRELLEATGAPSEGLRATLADLHHYGYVERTFAGWAITDDGVRLTDAAEG